MTEAPITPDEIDIIPAGQATEIDTLERLTPSVLFSPGGSQKLIERIQGEVSAFTADITTKKGRDEVKALAFKVAKSKTFLDTVGKTLNADLKKQAKAIDDQRSHIWDALEAIQHSVRAPVTAWEEAEETRTLGHQNALTELEALAKFDSPPSTALLQQRIGHLTDLGARDWEEHAEIAKSVIAGTEADLQVRLAASIKADDERAELESLRAAKAERDAEDARVAREATEAAAAKQRELEIAEAGRKAAEKATADAAEATRLANERAAAAAQKAADDLAAAQRKAADDLAAAVKKAEDDAARAAQAEKDRVAEAERTAREETLKREANRQHCSKINNDALAALVALSDTGLTHEQGKAIVSAIALDQIPHVKISY